MITIDTDNISVLPVKAKQPNDKLMLVPPPSDKCQHLLTSFTVDLDAGKCTCRTCGEEVTPWLVLERMMKQESLWQRNREGYQDEMKRLAERRKTKCDHCGKMTTISHR